MPFGAAVPIEAVVAVVPAACRFFDFLFAIQVISSCENKM